MLHPRPRPRHVQIPHPLAVPSRRRTRGPKHQRAPADPGPLTPHPSFLLGQVLDVMRNGASRRSTATTGMNDKSSRSHAVMLLELTQKDTEKGGSKTGKLYLVDLAGSEKVSKTGAEGAYTALDPTSAALAHPAWDSSISSFIELTRQVATDSAQLV